MAPGCYSLLAGCFLTQVLMQAAAWHVSHGGAECACAHETTASTYSSQRRTICANNATYSTASYSRLCDDLARATLSCSIFVCGRRTVRALHHAGMQAAGRIPCKHVTIETDWYVLHVCNSIAVRTVLAPFSEQHISLIDCSLHGSGFAPGFRSGEVRLQGVAGKIN